MTTRVKTALYSLLMVALGAVLFSFWKGGRHPASTAAGHFPLSLSDSTQAESQTNQPLYHCPMHPEIISETAGTCPICAMDLVPISSSGGNGESHAVWIAPEVVQNIGVVASEVQVAPLQKKVRLPAVIELIPDRVAAVSSRVNGWVEGAPRGTAGSAVRAGALLATIESPELLAAQENYLQFLKSDHRELLAAAERRLRSLGFSQRHLDSLQRSAAPLLALPLYSPIGGTVLQRHLVRGEAVTAGQELYRIANLQKVWAVGRLYTEELRDLKVGMELRVRVDGAPERHYKGTIATISPLLDPETKSAEVRVELDNRFAPHLKPGMNAELELLLDYGTGVAIPWQSVIQTGNRSLAVLSTGGGHYEPQELLLGRSLGDSVQVLEGLFPGDSILLSSHFLIDSESNLKKAVQSFQKKGSHHAAENH